MIVKKIVFFSFVKMVVFGGDGNWGCIICVIGYLGGWFVLDNIMIKIGGIEILNYSS